MQFRWNLVLWKFGVRRAFFPPAGIYMYFLSICGQRFHAILYNSIVVKFSTAAKAQRSFVEHPQNVRWSGKSGVENYFLRVFIWPRKKSRRKNYNKMTKRKTATNTHTQTHFINAIRIEIYERKQLVARVRAKRFLVIFLSLSRKLFRLFIQEKLFAKKSK